MHEDMFSLFFDNLGKGLLPSVRSGKTSFFNHLANIENEVPNVFATQWSYQSSKSQEGYCTMSDLNRNIETAEMELADLVNHRNALEAVGTDEYSDGTVIRFIKPMAIHGIVRKLVYVAVKKNDAWFVTGVSGPNEVDWNTLIHWAGLSNMEDREVVTKWEAAK